jgi:hypothetical protein
MELLYKKYRRTDYCCGTNGILNKLYKINYKRFKNAQINEEVVENNIKLKQMQSLTTNLSSLNGVWWYVICNE